MVESKNENKNWSETSYDSHATALKPICKNHELKMLTYLLAYKEVSVTLSQGG